MRHEFPVIENSTKSKITAVCKAGGALSWGKWQGIYRGERSVHRQGEANDSCHGKHDSNKLFNGVCSCYRGKASCMYWHRVELQSCSKVGWFHLQTGDMQTRSKYPLHFTVKHKRHGSWQWMQAEVRHMTCTQRRKEAGQSSCLKLINVKELWQLLLET